MPLNSHCQNGEVNYKLAEILGRATGWSHRLPSMNPAAGERITDASSHSDYFTDYPYHNYLHSKPYVTLVSESLCKMALCRWNVLLENCIVYQV